MPTSNNEIYRLLTEFNGKLGEVTGTLKAVNEKVDEIRLDISDSETTSAAYRAGVRDELAKIVTRTTHLESDMLSVKNKVDGMEQVTNDVSTLRTRAEGAGTVGRWLIRIGIGIVTFAGWAVGIYTYWTGRPPP